MSRQLNDEESQALYTWIDGITLSRPKRNIGRDFADGVMMAELVRHFYPRLVDVHNYPAANSLSQKLYNWNTLNRKNTSKSSLTTIIEKVFKKLNMFVSDVSVEKIANSRPGYVELVLHEFRLKVENARATLAAQGSRTSSASRSRFPDNGNSNENTYLASSGSRRQLTQQSNSLPSVNQAPMWQNPQMYQQQYPQQQQMMSSNESMQLQQQQAYLAYMAQMQQQHQHPTQWTQIRTPSAPRSLPPISYTQQATPVKVSSSTLPRPQIVRPGRQLEKSTNIHELEPMPPRQPNSTDKYNARLAAKRFVSVNMSPIETQHVPQRRDSYDSNEESQNNAVILALKLKQNERSVEDLSETVQILQLKISKLEQLVSLKDRKIGELQKMRNSQG